MVSHSHKIEVTLNEDLFQAIQSLAKASQCSIPDVSSELIQLAVEERGLEDAYFSKLVTQRVAKGNQELSHNEVWDALSDSVRQ